MEFLSLCNMNLLYQIHKVTIAAFVCNLSNSDQSSHRSIVGTNSINNALDNGLKMSLMLNVPLVADILQEQLCYNTKA
jgi:hypothetical protein